VGNTLTLSLFDLDGDDLCALLQDEIDLSGGVGEVVGRRMKIILFLDRTIRKNELVAIRLLRTFVVFCKSSQRNGIAACSPRAIA